MSQGEGRIEQLARNVAERTLPDWKVALQEADGDNERALIEQLRLVDGIIRSYDRHAAPAASDARGGSAAIKSGVLLGQRYRVLNHLGRGGMGEVWRAWDARLRVHVAGERERRLDYRVLTIDEVFLRDVALAELAGYCRCFRREAGVMRLDCPV